MPDTPPLRPEITPAGRIKLEKASAALNRSANDVLNRIVDAIEEIEIKEIITFKLRAEPESPAHHQGRKRIIIKKSSTFRSTF
jgi:hypothetical protein